MRYIITTAFAFCCWAVIGGVASPARAGVFEQLYAFQSGTDGAGPLASLIYVDGLLYGTTSEGGLSNCNGGCGTVFSINPSTGAETIVYAFKGGSDGGYPFANLLKVGNFLYGTTSSEGSSNCPG